MGEGMCGVEMGVPISILLFSAKATTAPASASLVTLEEWEGATYLIMQECRWGQHTYITTHLIQCHTYEIILKKGIVLHTFMQCIHTENDVTKLHVRTYLRVRTSMLLFMICSASMTLAVTRLLTATILCIHIMYSYCHNTYQSP